MEIILIKTLQLLCCLSLLVVLHEGGHFMFSKLFGVRVEKFYMFFNPYFHLFSTKDKWFSKLFPRISKNETEYGVGWIPLGGYVKIAGMIDESMDIEQMKQPAKPDEFRSQPVWKRFFIMVGGVLMNLITALVLYSMIMFVWGRDVMPIENFTDGYIYNEAAQKMGFRQGDIPVAADGKPIKYFDGTIIRPLTDSHTITVLREGKQVTFDVPTDHPNLLDVSEMTPPFISPLVPAYVDSIMPESPAAQAGMHKGDLILSVDGTELRCWADYDSLMVRKGDRLINATAADSINQRFMTVVVLHEAYVADAKPMKSFSRIARPDTLQLVLNEQYQMGVTRKIDFQTEHLDYTLLSCIPAGCKYGWQTLVTYVHDLKYVATPKGAQSVGSFITIGSIFPSAWDWQRFWMLTAFISIILAVMNILPIPGLDGGHVFFLLIEAVTRRPLSEKAQTVAEYIGMGILILLMVWAFGNDLMRFVF